MCGHGASQVGVWSARHVSGVFRTLAVLCKVYGMGDAKGDCMEGDKVCPVRCKKPEAGHEVRMMGCVRRCECTACQVQRT